MCHRLISSWKTDLNISLAALEMLSGLARTRIRETGNKNKVQIIMNILTIDLYALFYTSMMYLSLSCF